MANNPPHIDVDNVNKNESLNIEPPIQVDSPNVDNADREQPQPYVDSTSAATTRVVVPDGGYGWVVCFAAFMVIAITDGISMSFGELLRPLSGLLNVDEPQVAWIGATHYGLSICLSPLACGLSNKFGCRLVGMVGGTVMSVALTAMYFGNNYTYVLLIFGVVGGISCSFAATPAFILVSYYFERRRALATGIAMSGSGCKICDINFLMILQSISSFVHTRYCQELCIQDA